MRQGWAVYKMENGNWKRVSGGFTFQEACNIYNEKVEKEIESIFTINFFHGV